MCHIIVKMGLIGRGSLWTKSAWLMQIHRVHLQIFYQHRPPSVLFKNTLNRSAFLEFESPLNLLAHGCMLKNSNIAKMCTPRVRSGHRWHLCQSKLRHRTCDSLDRFPFHQSGPVKSQQTGKCAVTMHTCEWDAWKKNGGNISQRKWKKAEVEKHTHLLTGDQHQDCKPTFWVFVWHTAEISP